jgi:hypothetical protein
MYNQLPDIKPDTNSPRKYFFSLILHCQKKMKIEVFESRHTYQNAAFRTLEVMTNNLQTVQWWCYDVTQ